MTEIYFTTFSAAYRRPNFSTDFGTPFTPAAERFSPYATALTTGLSSLTRTAAARSTQTTVADGFFWLLKVLSNRLASRQDGRATDALPAAVQDSVQRRKERLLREVPAHLEAQARTTSTH